MIQITCISILSYALALLSFFTCNMHPNRFALCQRTLKIAQGFAAGLLTVLICFNMLPVSLQGIPLYLGLCSILFGVIFSIFLENFTGCTSLAAFFLFPYVLIILSYTEQWFFLSPRISPELLRICQCFIGGVLLHIACGEMMPDAKELWKTRLSALGACIGFIAGVLKIF